MQISDVFYIKTGEPIALSLDFVTIHNTPGIKSADIIKPHPSILFSINE